MDIEDLASSPVAFRTEPHRYGLDHLRVASTDGSGRPSRHAPHPPADREGGLWASG